MKAIPKIKRPEIRLRFKTEAAKRFFLGQLSDGWGENYCDLKWPWHRGIEFHDVRVFDVIVMGVHDGVGEVLTEDDANPGRAARLARLATTSPQRGPDE